MCFNYLDKRVKTSPSTENITYLKVEITVLQPPRLDYLNLQKRFSSHGYKTG